MRKRMIIEVRTRKGKRAVQVEIIRRVAPEVTKRLIEKYGYSARLIKT